MITVNFETKVVSIPLAYLTALGGVMYELDVDQLRLDIRDIEATPTGMANPDIHRYVPPVTVSGTTYAGFVEIINGYTVQFENGSYVVIARGANHNLADVKTVNQVSLITNNSAGLVLVGSGALGTPVGAETCTITVVDGAHGDAAIPDALVQLYGDGGSTLITFGRTSASGRVEVLLDPGLHTIRVYKPGVSAPSTTITVADTGGLTQQNFEFTAESIVISPPASPNLCRLYADLTNLDGSPISDQRIRIDNLYNPAAPLTFSVKPNTVEVVTNSAGHVEFDVIQGARIRLSFVGTALTRDIVVPLLPVAELFSVLGDTSDNFRVVSG